MSARCGCGDESHNIENGNCTLCAFSSRMKNHDEWRNKDNNDLKVVKEFRNWVVKYKEDLCQFCARPIAYQH